jgi:endonuclease YncB( thermonuclease family)
VVNLDFNTTGEETLLKTIFYSIRHVIIALFLIFMLTHCLPAVSTPRPGAVERAATVILPTPGPTPKPSPVSTRVIPVESLTPGSTPSQTPIPDKVRGLVVAVIDGQTIEVVLEGDPPGQTYQVRYLGIEAPPNQINTPWGVVAFETNRQLTSAKVVRIEKDRSDADAAGRLLRHVFLNDQLLSLLLVEQGLARANNTDPDTRYETEISAAETRAKESKLGLWGPPPTPTLRAAITTATTPAVTLTLTATAIITITPATTTEATPTGPAGISTSAPTRSPTPTATAEPTPTNQADN